MPEPFVAVEATAVVFRLCKIDGGFLPEGQMLPLIGWLEPSPSDIEDAIKRGRKAPGITVWNRELTSLVQARAIWAKGGQRGKTAGFHVPVGRVMQTAAKHRREVAVLSDPLTSGEPGGEGHCAIEGLRRPEGAPRNDHKVFLADLVRQFERMPEAA